MAAVGLWPCRALLARRGGALRALCGSVRGLAAEPETHFGFQTVTEAERREKIYKVFESVAEKYDVMNDSMTLGIHRVWKDILVHKMNPSPGTLLLDVAGGTGDIAFRFINYVRSVRERQLQRKLKHHQNLSWQEISESYQEDKSKSLGDSQVVVCDINKEMLKVGKQKAQHLGYSEGLSWVLGNAEELPFDDDKFDVYTIAFGIRNVTRIDLALQEAYRVLKPGGRFLCLEFSHVSNPLLSRLYDLYSFQVIPVLGEVIAGDWKSYQYLVESIRRFPPQEELKAMIEDAGFFKVDYQNLNLGIVAIHSGFKLIEEEFEEHVQQILAQQSDPEEHQLPFFCPKKPVGEATPVVFHTCVSLQAQHEGHGQNRAMPANEATSVTSGVDTETD